MPFFGMSCPQCQSQRLQKKRRSGTRYQALFSETGFRTGEYRYYPLQCQTCKQALYCQERYDYEAPYKQTLKSFVEADVYFKANTQKPGYEKIGTTVSQYTLMIATGADHPYALRRI